MDVDDSDFCDVPWDICDSYAGASEVNHNVPSLGGVVNELYVPCYYAGSALGTW